MKILVLSDSHASLSFMRRCVDTVAPDVIVHLGDHFDDGLTIHEEYPHIRIYQVPGNCDRYRCPPNQPEILIENVFGIKLYMTHGHLHKVKLTLSQLLRDARASGADAVLYGHTHEPACSLEEDGLWVLNPGSCGYYGGSAGLIRADNGKIVDCRLLRERELLDL